MRFRCFRHLAIRPGTSVSRFWSRGRGAVITGDVILHPLQIAHPEVCSTFDTDRTAAMKTRQEFIHARADRDVLVLGTHFTTPSGGKIVGAMHAAGGAYANVASATLNLSRQAGALCGVAVMGLLIELVAHWALTIRMAFATFAIGMCTPLWLIRHGTNPQSWPEVRGPTVPASRES